MTKSEILANRQTIIDFLIQPERKKYTKRLQNPEKGKDEERCCLGHMCKALGIPENRNIKTGRVYYSTHYATAPPELQQAVGISQTGMLTARKTIKIKDYKPHDCLVGINDNTPATSQEIGQYLETVIEGGDHTPWKDISCYEN